MAKRGVNGEGTIYKRKDGRFECAAYFVTSSGTRKRIRVYSRTWQGAHDKLVEAKMQAQQGVPVPDKSWKLSEFMDNWLENVVKPNKRPATYTQCEQATRLYLKPGLGRLPLAQLSVTTVQGFLNQQISDGHSIPKVQIIRKVLSAALTSAMREELVSRNVARLAVLPTYEPAEVRPWSADEAKQFLDAAEKHPLYPAFLLLVLYGLRRGEVLGLRWCDVDEDHGVLHIRQQLQRTYVGLRPGPVKTRAGRRDLPILGLVQQALASQRMRQAKLCWLPQDQHGDAGDEMLVFTAEDGQPMEPSRLVRSFQRVCRQHGIRRIRVHDVRHTTATILKKLGIPARDAQLILGHANITTTQQIYQHDDMDSRLAALGKVEELLRRSVGGGSERSRQVSRQDTFLGEIFTTPISGAGEGTLTPGLVLGKDAL